MKDKRILYIGYAIVGLYFYFKYRQIEKMKS
jgi:hypothetical protein